MHTALVVLVWLLLGWCAWLVVGAAVVVTWAVAHLRRAIRGDD